MRGLGLGPAFKKLEGRLGAAVERVVCRPVAQITLELGRNKDSDSGSPRGVDEVELLVAGDGRDDEVYPLQRVSQVLDIVIVDNGNLAAGAVFV